MDALQELRRAERKSAWGGIAMGTVVIALHLGMVVITGEPSQAYRSVLMVLGVLAVVQSIHSLRRIERLTQADVDAAARAEAFGRLIAATPLKHTWGLLAPIGVVMAVQLWLGVPRSIEVAGLVKAAARDNEPWRLLTGVLLHGNAIHVTMNLESLTGMGRAVERCLSPYYVPIVFLVSALAGSACSVLWMDETSVGSSGGIAGLLGFMVVFSRRRRDCVPDFVPRRLMGSLGMLVAVGGLGFAVIDNAAHFGGLVGGAALAWLLVPRSGDPRVVGRWTVALGWGALAAVVGGAVVATAVMLRP